MSSTGSSQQDEELKIISIVGMGGIGKTTLAKYVYNDDEVKAYFKGQRIWVCHCVSEPFEIVKIAKEITEQLNDQIPTTVSSELLIRRFHESIGGKKFLLVLDDVWTISPEKSCQTVSISNTTTKLHSLMVSYNAHRTYIFPDQFLDLTCLRTLSLSGESMELPKNIGHLVRLRYLSLSNMNFKYIKVPLAIGDLFHLQTLRLLCEVTELPEEIRKLINLRHLYICYGEELSWPKSIGKLRSLQTLKMILISPNGQNFQLQDYRNLNSLRDIYLQGLGGEEHLEEAKEAQLHNKTALISLTLYFDSDDTKMENHETVLETLRPHENLKCLVISYYCGRSISPSWMMCLINLRELRLRNCHRYEILPPLGKLPCLELLDVVQSDGLKKLGPEFLGVEIDNGDGRGGAINITSAATFFSKTETTQDRLCTVIVRMGRTPGVDGEWSCEDNASS
ncbi:NB-ARC domain, LRR domain containing protein [Parasponia andersonii]|uniref:NB-ARC domain, LRR domain containing protein n=1 Tax=Parasponia andersonii TaxID=3476 RepID=A0A2P5E3C0_PARAD|nr:NB-ARC domain, LRR domain containing protein [Parasponia andersonii]